MSGKSLTWLHLSDLHRCSTRDGGAGEIVLRRLRGDLETLRADHGLRPDLIFMTGDLAFGHLPEQSLDDQLVEGWIWLEEVRQLYDPEVPADHVFLVPGNHDIDRNKVKDKDQEWLRAKADADDKDRIRRLLHEAGGEWRDYMGRLAAFEAFIKDNYPHLADSGGRCVFSVTRAVAGLRVAIAGFNSAWSCGTDDDKSHLWLGEWQVDELVSKVTDADLRVALVHHPFNWLVEPEDPKLEARVQSEFHVLLHGHEHHLWVETPQTRHLQVAAGAVHDRPDEPLGYNFARFDLEAKTGEVWLRCLDSDTRKWMAKVVPDHTDGRGVWKVPLPWDPGRSDSTPAGPKPPSPDPPPPPPALTDAEQHGVFGRRGDIDKLGRLLGAKRIALVYGLSGIGKSRLVKEVARATGREYRTVRVMPGMGFAELYGRLALEIGCREPDPRPVGAAGFFNFSAIGKWAKTLAGPRLVHVQGGHFLFAGTEALDANVARLFQEVEAQSPEVRLVLESQETPPAGLLPGAVAGRVKVKGLKAKSLGGYFRRPLPERPEVGWHLGRDDLTQLAARLSGDRKKADDVHPMALFLLVSIAAELKIAPPEVFERFRDRFHKALNDSLFDILYEKVLNGTEQRMLRLCALYRDGVAIVKKHVEPLSERVGDDDAFASLGRRLVLERHGEDYVLHGLLRQLAQARLVRSSDEVLDDHSVIAGAWLEGVRYGRRFNLPDAVANNEAFYHLKQAQDYPKLVELEGRHLRHGTAEQLRELCLELRNKEDFEGRRVVLELWLDIEDDHMAHRFLGETLERLKGRGATEALEHYRQAVAVRPDYPQYLTSYGRCLLKRGEGSELCEHLGGLEPAERTKALRNEHLVSVYGQCLEQVGRGEDASELRQLRLREGSRHAALFQNEARYLRARGQLQGALDLLDQAAARGLADDYTLNLRGEILGDMGQGEKASEQRRRRIAEGTTDVVVFADEAKYQRARGRHREALDLLDQAEQSGLANDFTLSIRCEVLGDLGRGDEASGLRHRRIGEGSLHVALFGAEAAYLRSQGRLDEALDLLDGAEHLGIANDYSRRLRRAIEADPRSTAGKG